MMTIDCNKPNLPIVNENAIKVNTGKDKQTSYTTKDPKKNKIPEFELSKLIAQGIKKYSTDSDPNISKTELNDFKREIYEGFIGLKDSELAIYQEVGYEYTGSNRVVVKDAVLNSFDRLYNVYTEDEKITPEEYTKMLETILNSTQNCEKTNSSQKQEEVTMNTNIENKVTTEIESQPRKKYWFGGLIDLGRAIIWSINGD